MSYMKIGRLPSSTTILSSTNKQNVLTAHIGHEERSIYPVVQYDAKVSNVIDHKTT